MNPERMLHLIKAPRISEKSVMVGNKHRQIVFKVQKDATKPEIKAAVEQLFQVKVTSVSVLNVLGKTKRFKQVKGKRSDWKKAYVSLAQGHDIDFSSMN